MTTNNTLFQFFHWYTPNDGQWWNYCASEAESLAKKGITHVYLPPAYKSALGNSEPGYAVYDLYDLGEFDQKGTVRTKYGTKEEYLACIKKMQAAKLSVIADIVLNHRHGADEQETFMATIVNMDNRNEIISEPHMIEGYTKFIFPGRGDTYSNFKWNYTCFTGIDGYIDSNNVIYSIQNDYGEGWEDVMEDEHGNYDFLMGADVEFRNEHVRSELLAWGKWYIETTGIDGFRMDAVKHISHEFLKVWLQQMREVTNKPLFYVSEYWKAHVEPLLKYLDAVENTTQLFDAPLHYNFFMAAQKGRDYDLRQIYDGSLVQLKPELSVTFVENHDTQPLQSLESTVDYWFKPLAYAIILLRQQGTPLVFYPCLYGVSYTDKKDEVQLDIHLEKVHELEQLLHVRKQLAYGNQNEYFDHPNVIGWTREGIDEIANSGCAVLLSNGDDGEKIMHMGIHHANKIFVDCCGHVNEQVTTDNDGNGLFFVKGGKVSVWIIKQ